jgi:hypothetical protein
MVSHIELATAGLISEWKLPITKGHVILFKGGGYGESTFFEVDGFITYDAPHMIAGVKYRPREKQPVRAPGWKRQKRDEYTGVIIEPIEGTDIREGSVRSGRCSLEHLLQYAVGLAIGQVFESRGALQLVGVNQTIPLDAKAQARPRLHLSTTPPWCTRVSQFVKEQKRRVETLTTDGSSREKGSKLLEDQWNPLESRKIAQEAIMLFDSEIRKQTDTDPRGPVATIVITDLPPEVGVNSNYTKLLVLAAAHQLAPAIDQTVPPKIESDAMSILAHAEKDSKTRAQRSRDSQTMGPLYRAIRRARLNCRRLKAAHTRSSHPEEEKRAYSTFNSKESRILTTDAYAERRLMQETEEAVNRAMNKGLKYNVRVEPDNVLYVTAEKSWRGSTSRANSTGRKKAAP